MSHDDRVERFDVRGVNLIKITRVIDLEIVIAEADFVVGDIDSQINGSARDANWKMGAERAKREINHKRKLAVMKRDAMLNTTFEARFMQQAALLLDPETYEKIVEAARSGAREQPPEQVVQERAA